MKITLFAKTAHSRDGKAFELQIVKVVEFKEVHKLYGMPCAEFYKNAVELDPETRKTLAK